MSDTTPTETPAEAKTAFVSGLPAPVTVNVINRASYRQTHHVAHAILTLLTGGLWLVVWIPRAIGNGRVNRKNGY